ncbi:MAG: AI-2E family transporter, partial [Chloroflexota bacterium]
MTRSTPPPLTSARWGPRTKRIVGIFVVIALFLALIVFRDVLPLLVVAVLLSYLLWPLVNLIDQRVLGFIPFRVRSFAVLLTFLTVIATFVAAVILILPVIINQISQIGQELPAFIETLETEVRRVLSRPITFNGVPVLLNGEPLIPMDRIEAVTAENGISGIFEAENFDVFQILGAFFGSLTAPAFSVVGGAITAIINITFLLVVMFYMMRDGDKFIIHIVNVVPLSYRGDVQRLLHELGRVWNAYLRGQLILCFVIGMAVYVAALALGLPSAPVLGLLAGMLEFIPNLGPFLALVPAALIALVSESSTLPFLSGLPFALVVIAVWTGIQQLEAIYVVPRVMGGSLNLHPVVVILAVISGASVGGALGIILAAPFTATARVVGQYFYGKLFDIDPFPTPKPYERASKRPPIMRLVGVVRHVSNRVG